MALTEERTVLLGNYLNENPEKAEKLLSLSVEDATAQINADGFDFTTDEIQEFGDNLKKFASSDGELDEDSLANVSGGVITTAAATVYLACIGGGWALGSAIGKKWGW